MWGAQWCGCDPQCASNASITVPTSQVGGGWGLKGSQQHALWEGNWPFNSFMGNCIINHICVRSTERLPQYIEGNKIIGLFNAPHPTNLGGRGITGGSCINIK